MADVTTATKVLAKCTESDMRCEVARLNGKALPPVFGMETLCGEQPSGRFGVRAPRLLAHGVSQGRLPPPETAAAKQRTPPQSAERLWRQFGARKMVCICGAELMQHGGRRACRSPSITCLGLTMSRVHGKGKGAREQGTGGAQGWLPC